MNKACREKDFFLEELVNSITHGAGFLLSLIASSFLAVAAYGSGDIRRIVSVVIYGVSLVVLYAASTLYHSFPLGRTKHIFRIIDHSAIYILIAGSYTPVALISLEGVWGWSLLWVLWGLTFSGILFKVFFVNRFFVVSSVIYVLMGWLALFAVRPLLANIATGGILWLLASGFFYTFGIIFHFFKNLPYAHAVWHLFVLAGSACHYFALLFYIFPGK